MSYSLTDINYRTVTDPRGFLEESDAAYDKKEFHWEDADYTPPMTKRCARRRTRSRQT